MRKIATGLLGRMAEEKTPAHQLPWVHKYDWGNGHADFLKAHSEGLVTLQKFKEHLTPDGEKALAHHKGDTARAATNARMDTNTQHPTAGFYDRMHEGFFHPQVREDMIKDYETRMGWRKTANYKLQGEYDFRGLDVAVENKKGSKRSWYDPHGKEKGSTHMYYDYGYIRLTEGTDGDHVDCYVGPDKDAKSVFIVNQMKKPEGEIKKDGKAWDKFDEQKCMLGFKSAAEAKAAYLRQYNDPRFFGSMKEMPFEEFKMKVLDKKNHGKKIAKLLHTATGAIYGGAAADSQVRLPDEESDKTAVSAAWIREKAVSGLAKRNIVLDGSQQSQIARKAVNYARTKAKGEGADLARKELRDILGTFKDKMPNAGRRASRPPNDWSRNVDWGPDVGRWARDAEHAGHIPHDDPFKYVIPLSVVGAVGNLLAGASTLPRDLNTEQTSRFVTAAKRKMRKGQEVDFAEAPKIREHSNLRRIGAGVGLGLNFGTAGAGLGSLLGGRVGAGAGALAGGVLGARAGVGSYDTGQKRHDKKHKDLSSLREQYEAAMPKAAAISPAVLSHLQHGGVGAGVGALAGGIGGLLHADPQHKGQGALRGALVGAGLGAAGGAGLSAIKSHGASQLATLQGAAQKAEQQAVQANQHVKGLNQTGWSAPVAPARGNATVAARPGPKTAPTVPLHDTGMSTVAGAGRTPKAAPPAKSLHGEAAVMAPNFQATQSPYHPGEGLMQGQEGVYRKVPMEHGPRMAAPSPASAHGQLSQRFDVAQQQASAAGARAAGLGQAAHTLQQQQGVMNTAINRAGLAGAAAGTGLMGYMAVPSQYGGVAKQADDGRVGRIADRIDDAGIALLAAPYAADASAHGLKKIMLRGGRMGALAAEGHGIAEALAHKLHNQPKRELAGLAMVAPGVTHPAAKLLDKVLPKKQPVPDVVNTAKEAGRVLANKDHLAKVSGLGRLAMGLGAVGTAGAALYGGKKAIDVTKGLATHRHDAARYVGVPPGMRPPTPAGA